MLYLNWRLMSRRQTSVSSSLVSSPRALANYSLAGTDYHCTHSSEAQLTNPLAASDEDKTTCRQTYLSGGLPGLLGLARSYGDEKQFFVLAGATTAQRTPPKSPFERLALVDGPCAQTKAEAAYAPSPGSSSGTNLLHAGLTVCSCKADVTASNNNGTASVKRPPGSRSALTAAPAPSQP